MLLADLDTEHHGNLKIRLLDFEDDEVTTAQERSLSALITTLLNHFNITELGGHKEHQVFYIDTNNKNKSSTERTCPGDRGMELVHKLRKKFSLGVPTKFIKKG